MTDEFRGSFDRMTERIAIDTVIHRILPHPAVASPRKPELADSSEVNGKPNKVTDQPELAD